MDEQKRPRAWVYARIPGDYDGTMNSYKVCSMQALHDGCDIVGGSIDERGGWLLRPGYRDMMQQIKGGKVDRVYICRMRQISGKERHLYSFFKRLMQRGIQANAMLPERGCSCRGDFQQAAYCANGKVRASMSFCCHDSKTTTC